MNSGSLSPTSKIKIKTGIHPERAGVVKAVLVHPGSQIEAKDLLVEME